MKFIKVRKYFQFHDRYKSKGTGIRLMLRKPYEGEAGKVPLVERRAKPDIRASFDSLRAIQSLRVDETPI